MMQEKIEFSFGAISKQTTKKSAKLELIKDIILIDNSISNSTIIIVDRLYSEMELKAICTFLQQSGLKDYIIVNPLLFAFEAKSEAIINFYATNQNNWRVAISDYNIRNVISVGAALYCLTKTDDLMIDCVLDPLSVSSIYIPDLSIFAYPIFSFSDYFVSRGKPPLDTYRKNHALWQIKRSLDENREVDSTKPNLICLNKEEFEAVLKANEDKTHIVYDLETSGFDCYKDKIGCFQFTFDGITGYYVNWGNVNKRALNFFLKDKIQIGANLKFDVKFLRVNGISNTRIDEDTMIIGHLLNENRFNSLKTHAWIYTPFGGYDIQLEELKKGKKKKDVVYTDIREDILAKYAIMDVIVTYRVWKGLTKDLKDFDIKHPHFLPKTSLEYYYREFRLRAVNSYVEIELHGLIVDINKLHAARAKVKEKLASIEQQVRESLGLKAKMLDINSQVQLGTYIESLGWKDYGRRKDTNTFSTSDAEMERWLIDGHKEAALIQEYRSTKVILTTYLGNTDNEGWGQHLVLHLDGTYRVHSTYESMMADTNRSRCHDPNFQNIPSGGYAGDVVRSIFSTPGDANFVFCTADSAALQIRLAAIESEDKKLFEVFTNPLADPHSSGAVKTFCNNREFEFTKITDEQGNSYEFPSDHEVLTKRGKIKAKDLIESDELIFN